MNTIMNRLKLGLAHPTLFDQGIEAARNACVAGASIAAAAVVASAYCDSPLVGTPALRRCMMHLLTLPFDVAEWASTFACPNHAGTGDPSFAPGFGYIQKAQFEFVHRLARRLARLQRRTGAGARCDFYLAHHEQLTARCGPLNPVGLMALVSLDQGYTIEHAERQHLAWNIERAICAAQQASHIGISRFPFLTDIYNYEGSWPEATAKPSDDSLRLIGLEQ